MGAPYGEMAAAYQELADEDLTNDIASGHGPKVAQMVSEGAKMTPQGPPT